MPSWGVGMEPLRLHTPIGSGGGAEGERSASSDEADERLGRVRDPGREDLDQVVGRPS